MLSSKRKLRDDHENDWIHYIVFTLTCWFVLYFYQNGKKLLTFHFLGPKPFHCLQLQSSLNNLEMNISQQLCIIIQKKAAIRRDTFSFRCAFHLTISFASKHWTERHRFRSNPLWSGLQCNSSSPSGGAKPHYTSLARPSLKPSSQTILSFRCCFVCVLLLMWFNLDWSGA